MGPTSIEPDPGGIVISPVTTYRVGCPSCDSEFPVDPARVPQGGVHAICSTCLRVFPVFAPGDADFTTAVHEEPELAGAVASDVDRKDAEDTTADEDATAPGTGLEDGPAALEDLTSLAPDASAASGTSSAPPDSAVADVSLSAGVSRFGARDPHDRAYRLARVLVSDIIAYYPKQYRQALAQGTLKEDLQDEVRKSWKEYVDQVGEELADSTTYFADALNEILAEGEQIFD